MARWLAVRLAGPSTGSCTTGTPNCSPSRPRTHRTQQRTAAPVTVETRLGDITRLEPGDLASAALVTASALLDMLTAAELDRLVAGCAGAGCPVLVPLSVTGAVDLTPADAFDRPVREAFNSHQRRSTGPGRLLGPDAVGAAVDGLRRLGLDVLVRPSPWVLGPADAALAARWFAGWWGAAREQRPELGAEAAPYARRRLAQATAGRLSVTVHHLDLLAWPR